MRPGGIAINSGEGGEGVHRAAPYRGPEGRTHEAGRVCCGRVPWPVSCAAEAAVEGGSRNGDDNANSASAITSKRSFSAAKMPSRCAATWTKRFISPCTHTVRSNVVALTERPGSSDPPDTLCPRSLLWVHLVIIDGNTACWQASQRQDTCAASTGEVSSHPPMNCYETTSVCKARHQVDEEPSLIR